MANKSIKQGKLTTTAAKQKVRCYWDPLSTGVTCILLKAHWKQAEPALATTQEILSSGQTHVAMMYKETMEYTFKTTCHNPPNHCTQL